LRKFSFISVAGVRLGNTFVANHGTTAFSYVFCSFPDLPFTSHSALQLFRITPYEPSPTLTPPQIRTRPAPTPVPLAQTNPSSTRTSFLTLPNLSPVLRSS
jgi:hypothetical protein